MSEQPFLIDGKPVTEGNARRFVIARAPLAEARRITERNGFRRSTAVVVRPRVDGLPWCHARASTAKEAWLKAARQMVEHDARLAAEKQALEHAVAALSAAETSRSLEVAALRYASVRVRQDERRYSGERGRQADELVAMADAMESP